jgi:activator of HSP90 ATPase
LQTNYRPLDVPEVSHEITLDKLHDYSVSALKACNPCTPHLKSQYSWEMTTTASEHANSLLALAKTRLPPALESKFNAFPSILMDIHGKDITVSAPNSQEPSRSATPVTPASTGNVPPSTQNKPATTSKGLNTTSLTVEASFMASADDMFTILTDEKRIPQWSRNSAVVGAVTQPCAYFDSPLFSRIRLPAPLTPSSVEV